MVSPDQERMVRWCIRLTRLTLVCEVIRYRLVQVRQNQKKKKKKKKRPLLCFCLKTVGKRKVAGSSRLGYMRGGKSGGWCCLIGEEELAIGWTEGCVRWILALHAVYADGLCDVRVGAIVAADMASESTHQLVQQTETADGASRFKAVYNQHDTGAKKDSACRWSFALFLAKNLHLSFSPLKGRWVHTFRCQKRCTLRISSC